MRQSTTEHTRQTFLRLQERQVQSKRKKGAGPSYDRPLTQEELLEEAKLTEEINLRSLGELVENSSPEKLLVPNICCNYISENAIEKCVREAEPCSQSHPLPGHLNCCKPFPKVPGERGSKMKLPWQCEWNIMEAKEEELGARAC